MKKKKLQTLQLNKRAIAHIDQVKISGGISLICTASLSWFACDTGGKTDEPILNTEEICQA